MDNKFYQKWLPAVIILFGLLLPAIGFAGGFNARPHQAHKNLLGVFLGATSSKHATDFTYGLEYWRNFWRRFGLLMSFEHNPAADHGKGTLQGTALVTFELFKHMVIGGGGGFRRIFNDKTLGVARIHAAYELALSQRVALVPNVNVDFVHGEVECVYGITFGVVF